MNFGREFCLVRGAALQHRATVSGRENGDEQLDIWKILPTLSLRFMVSGATNVVSNFRVDHEDGHIRLRSVNTCAYKVELVTDKAMTRQ